MELDVDGDPGELRVSAFWAGASKRTRGVAFNTLCGFVFVSCVVWVKLLCLGCGGLANTIRMAQRTQRRLPGRGANAIVASYDNTGAEVRCRAFSNREGKPAACHLEELCRELPHAPRMLRGEFTVYT